MLPREEKRQDKRTRILDAAVRVFAERGFFTATVAEIARAAGVADGTIYLYFKGKDDLLLRLFEEKMGDVLAQAQAALVEERTAPAKLRRFITLHLAMVEKNPEFAQVFIIELRQSAQLVNHVRGGKLSAYLDVLAGVVKEGQEKGQLAGDVSPATVKRAVFGALDELALGWLLSGRRTSLRKSAGEVADWFVRGLVPATNGGKSS